VLSEHIEGIVNLDPKLDYTCVSEQYASAFQKGYVLLVAKLATMPVVIPRTTLAHGGR
jgi:hypothetical protein